MSKKVAVIVRHLPFPGCVPIIHAVIGIDENADIDDEEHYLKEKAERNIEAFKKQFVEFNNATFHCAIMEVI